MMKLMSAPKKNMFKPAIELFLGEKIIGFSVYKNEDEDEDIIEFITKTAAIGCCVLDFSQDLYVWIDDELAYEIEQELIPLLTYNDDKELLNLYEYIKEINYDMLKPQSKLFVDIVIASTEKLILSGNLSLEGSVIIGGQEVIYKNGRNVQLSLN
jgi:hypothetical protein